MKNEQAKPKEKYIYVIDSSKGRLKVGISWQPLKRMSGLQSPLTGELKLLGQWFHEQARTVEDLAHSFLDKHRVLDEPGLGREWFRVPRQDAFDAVMRAMMQVARADCPAEKAIPTPQAEKPPPLPQIEGEAKEFQFGYARSVEGASAAAQVQWMRNFGVDPVDIYFEQQGIVTRIREGAIKEAQSGDVFLVWSPDVLGTDEEVTAIKARLISQEARLLFAHDAPEVGL